MQRQRFSAILGALIMTSTMSFIGPSATGLMKLSVLEHFGHRVYTYRRFGTALRSAWNVGDFVFLPRNKGAKELVGGVIKESRGSGWYAVIIQESGHVVKCRSTQLRTPEYLSLLESVPSSNVTNASVVMPVLNNDRETPVPPTILDLDAAIQDSFSDPVEKQSDQEYLDHVANHISYKKWVVFTDLHCAPSTLNTTLEVLDHVHALAVDRNAGLLFLGDFWHHRGTIRVDCLNAVLDTLKHWVAPMVMIPGNHDQVTLGGQNHGLTPLQNAYRIPAAANTHLNATVAYSGKTTPKTFPGPLIFSHPTKFSNALMIPHIRDNAIMESVLQSNYAHEAHAIFAHADVTGACMNDIVISLGGVRPSMFPPNKPIYSGHFHKPHIVESKSKNVSIEYLGSPYQVSLSEAQQDKAVVVLDSSDGWKCIERIPLAIGRKHFRAENVEDLLKLWPLTEVSDTTIDNKSFVKPNDRVVVNIDAETLNELRRSSSVGTDNRFVAHVDMLRKHGVIVEVRERSQDALAPSTNNELEAFPEWEDLSLESVWISFLDDQVVREALTNTTSAELRTTGIELLEELEAENDVIRADRKLERTELELDSVSVEGFGPFRHETRYPLKDRGLVLLRGSNSDGGSDSNGSGKTSLAVATLWALTGSVDPRPLQDAKVSDVINDSTKAARVTVRGRLNDSEFSVTRSKTARGGTLTFMLDGHDLTTQSVTETQVLIDENLGISPQILARTLFHGQHAKNELVEASDAKFKEELSLVVPLQRWQEAASFARRRARISSNRAAELEGMISIRSLDLKEAIGRLNNEVDSLANSKASLREIGSAYNAELRLQCDKENPFGEEDSTVEALRSKYRDHESDLEMMEEQRIAWEGKRKEEISNVEIRLNQLEVGVENTVKHVVGLRQQQEAWGYRFTSARENMNNLEAMWGLPSIERGIPDNFALPATCPTCQRPLSVHGESDAHSVKLQHKILIDITSVVKRFDLARRQVKSTMELMNQAEKTKMKLEKRIADERTELTRLNTLWNDKVGRKEKQIQLARQSKDDTAKQLADMAMRLQRDASLNRLKINLEAGQQKVKLARASVEDARNQVTKFKQALQRLREERDNATNAVAVLSNLAEAFGQRGVQTFVLQRTIELLERATQSYLTELSDGCQRLELQLDSGDRIVRRAFVIGEKGEFVERPVATLSGGQYRRCSLALNFGFAELVSQRGNFRPSLCILDEPLTHLDRTGRSDVGRVLRMMLRPTREGAVNQSLSLTFSTVLLILQDLSAEELEEAFDHIDEVVKRDGVSHVVIDGESIAS